MQIKKKTIKFGKSTNFENYCFKNLIFLLQITFNNLFCKLNIKRTSGLVKLRGYGDGLLSLPKYIVMYVAV